MKIKKYQLGDELEIISLFKLTFGKEISIPYWKWRFSENPFRTQSIYLMWDKELLVGHYAVCPVRLKVHGKLLKAGLSMTTMTHPAYSGKGVFTKLASALYSEEDIDLVYGFPNNNSHRGFIKNLDWQNITTIPTFRLLINEEVKCVNNIRTSNIFYEKHEKSLKVNTKINTIQVLKDVTYLNWRYCENPINKYTIFELDKNGITNFIVAKIFQSFSKKNYFEIDLVEISTINNYDIINTLIKGVINYYNKKFPLFAVNTWMPLNDTKHIILEKVGFKNAEPITYFGVRPIKIHNEELLNAKNWHYTMGESDVY